jgi:hypothetical protein
MTKYKILAIQTETYSKEFEVEADDYLEALQKLQRMMEDVDLTMYKNAYESTELTYESLDDTDS